MTKIKLPLKPISFEWDEGNLEKNWLKHQVSRDESEQVFSNEPIRFILDITHSQTEERFVAYGKTDNGRLLAIFFTYRNLLIRIISARDQSKKEKKVYETK